MDFAQTGIGAASEGDSDCRQRTYTNPVIDRDFPDPCVIRGRDELFYAYATQSRQDGHWVNVQLARSPDLVNWELLGDAMPERPAWADPEGPTMAPNAITGERGIYLYFATRPKWQKGMHRGRGCRQPGGTV